MNSSYLYNKIINSIAKTVKLALNENECKHMGNSTQVGNPISLFYRGYEIEISQWRCDRCGDISWGYSITPWPEEEYIAEAGFDTDTDAFIDAKETIDLNIKKHVIKPKNLY